MPDHIIGLDDPVLVTGSAGFLGVRVVECLLDAGFQNVRCLARPSSDCSRLEAAIGTRSAGERAKIVSGNLLSRADCERVTHGVAVIYHLAAGTGSKSFADAFLNSVVTTRNLVEAALAQGSLRRLVSTSSFVVYANRGNPGGRLLDESAPMESDPGSRYEAYCYAKVKQDELLMDYGRTRGLKYVLLRPGVVFGPGKNSITGRVGTDTFGVFMHMGGGNRMPFTYVENCAEAIVLAGLKPGVDGEIFNIVDNDLPTSRQFLRQYKRKVRPLRSLYVPHWMSYLLCWAWECYSTWSHEQLPPVFTRREWAATWKRTRYSNEKAKRLLGWTPRVPMAEAMERYFEDCRRKVGR